MKKFYWSLKIISAVGFLVAITKIPGRVSLEWFTYSFETTLPVFFLFLTIFYVLAFSIIWLLRFPGKWKKKIKLRNLEKNEEKHMENLIKFFSKEYSQIKSSINDDSRDLVIAAYSHLYSNDLRNAEVFFKEICQRKDISFLGHEGLYQISHKQNDTAGERSHLKQAINTRPKNTWVKKTYAKHIFKNGSLSEKRHALEILITVDDIKKDENKKLHAYKNLLSPDNDREKELYNALKILKKDINHIVEYSNILKSKGGAKSSIKYLKKSYMNFPSVEIAKHALSMGDFKNNVEKYNWICDFTKDHEENVETNLIRAEAAINASIWGSVEKHIEKVILKEQSKRVHELLMKYESANDDAREFLNFHNIKFEMDYKHWKCESCNSNHEKWEIICNECTGIDTINHSK